MPLCSVALTLGDWWSGDLFSSARLIETSGGGRPSVPRMNVLHTGLSRELSRCNEAT